MTSQGLVVNHQSVRRKIFRVNSGFWPKIGGDLDIAPAFGPTRRSPIRHVIGGASTGSLPRAALWSQTVLGSLVRNPA